MDCLVTLLDSVMHLWFIYSFFCMIFSIEFLLLSKTSVMKLIALYFRCNVLQCMPFPKVTLRNLLFYYLHIFLVYFSCWLFFCLCRSTIKAASLLQLRGNGSQGRPVYVCMFLRDWGKIVQRRDGGVLSGSLSGLWTSKKKKG